MINCNIYVDFCLNLSRAWRFETHNEIGTRRKQNRQARLPPNQVPVFLLLVKLILIYLRVTANHPASRTFLLLTRVCATWQNLYFSSSQEDKSRFCSAGFRKHESDQNPEGTLRCVTTIGAVLWILSKLKRLKLPPKWVKQHQKTLKMDEQTWRR